MEAFEQGGCIIKIHYGKINLALMCEWFEGEGLKKERIARELFCREATDELDTGWGGR